MQQETGKSVDLYYLYFHQFIQHLMTKHILLLLLCFFLSPDHIGNTCVGQEPLNYEANPSLRIPRRIDCGSKEITPELYEYLLRKRAEANIVSYESATVSIHSKIESREISWLLICMGSILWGLCLGWINNRPSKKT